jgi:hypothetical protein
LLEDGSLNSSGTYLFKIRFTAGSDLKLSPEEGSRGFKFWMIMTGVGDRVPYIYPTATYHRSNDPIPPNTDRYLPKQTRMTYHALPTTSTIPYIITALTAIALGPNTSHTLHCNHLGLLSAYSCSWATLACNASIICKAVEAIYLIIAVLMAAGYSIGTKSKPHPCDSFHPTLVFRQSPL